MKKTMTETKEIDIDDFEVVDFAKSEFTLEKNFIDRVKILGINEIEPLLEEDVKVIRRLEKWGFLALLRDLFNEFKKLGDTKIIVREGTCGICGAYVVKSSYSSIKPVRKVIEMRGNNSKETFHFALLSQPQEALNVRICDGFIDKSGNRIDSFSTQSMLSQFARSRQAELSGYK
jgi:hypothetical protein